MAGALHLTRRRSRLLAGVLGAALAGAGMALGQPVGAGLLLVWSPRWVCGPRATCRARPDRAGGRGWHFTSRRR
ncbi:MULTISPECIES: hypothetical protein [unclassified Deinococcus]|uniref:hypothetical protein n=1 Tax=unclassified Deinococcus TaxID=2623546 RepID=UPI001C306A02|nr:MULTISPECIES: hypothetical protein [unclassified Deinococcus]MDK2011337.1 hypothetical protein [Deinococcus sp. 43]